MAFLSDTQLTVAGRRIIFRADAGVDIGTGHVMRCLALAQAWCDAGGEAAFAAIQLPEALESLIRAEKLGLHYLNSPAGSEEDARETARFAGEFGAPWVVVDGYVFGETYYSTLKSSGLKVLALDDYGHSERYEVDILLNQNEYADPRLYQGRASGARLLLGSRYVLLRREFNRYQKWHRDVSTIARRILITLGGTDPSNITQSVLKAIFSINTHELEVIAVVGSGNPHLEAIKRAAHAIGDKVQVLNAVNDMPDRMAWADIAVSAAGSTVWELAFMGLPSFIIAVAANQEPAFKMLVFRNAAVGIDKYGLARQDFLYNLIEQLVIDKKRRQELSRNEKALVDGLGCQRVVAEILRSKEHYSSL